MVVPPKPEAFDAMIPPPGFELKLISFWADRPRIKPRLQLVHTNGASREGSVEASYNWANQPGSGHTIPHLQIDRSGRGAMLLPADRKGIGNGTVTPQHDDWWKLTATQRAEITAHGYPANWSLVFETADTGYLADPNISAFTDKQAESVAVACAYYAWGYTIPLEYPKTWDGAGTASHTEPFGYPYWTNARGKICPGVKKKQQMRDVVLPRARQILDAWTAPPEENELTDDERKALVDEIAAKVWQGFRFVDVATGNPITGEQSLGYIRRDTARLRMALLDDVGTSVDKLSAAVAAKVGTDATAKEIADAVLAAIGAELTD